MTLAARIGWRVYTWRIAHGWTQSRAAKVGGLSVTTYARVERGAGARVTLEHVAQACSAVGLQLEDAVAFRTWRKARGL